MGSGHLALLLATQLFLTHGSWEQPRQQTEAKVTEVGGQELPPPHGKPAPQQGKNLAVRKRKADTTPVRFLSRADAWPCCANGH